jgi:hypothetical protein
MFLQESLSVSLFRLEMLLLLVVWGYLGIALISSSRCFANHNEERDLDLNAIKPTYFRLQLHATQIDPKLREESIPRAVSISIKVYGRPGQNTSHEQERKAP